MKRMGVQYSIERPEVLKNLSPDLITAKHTAFVENIAELARDGYNEIHVDPYTDSYKGEIRLVFTKITPF